MNATAATCPVHQGRDDRKSARIADPNIKPMEGATLVHGFAASRGVLRSPDVLQAGANADDVVLDNPDHVSFFFLDGEVHRKRRAAVAGFFAPKTITTRYHAVMNQTMDKLVDQLRKGPQPLDELSFQMAVDVAADIIGLTNSDSNLNLARRIRLMLDSTTVMERGRIGRVFHMLLMMLRASNFYRKDLKPAIEARRKEPKEDVISYMLSEGYSKKAMIMECLTYGAAGMMTTREFIVMTAWHLFDKPDLLERFLSGSEQDQFAILEEILRIEPVASLLHRRATKDFVDANGDHVKEGELLCLNLREANTDEAITGPCPYEIDPDRAKRMKVVGPYLSFGDGAHRCPGAQVALHETRIFLDRMFRLPGIRLLSEPDIIWNPAIQGYELRGAVVACDPA